MREITDHTWVKIQDRDYIGRIAVDQKLEEVALLTAAISKAEGLEVANRIMDRGRIGFALARCKQWHLEDDRVTDDDLHIYYRYATDSMRNAEAILAKELPHIGL
ncbi:hypothetical protein [Pseudomonas sp. TE50-2]|uniref:hypothetical protein n=1 Tax=Pseudomonas sp. TE50-2 TaxID=3142707 RepID=UPI00346551A0